MGTNKGILDRGWTHYEALISDCYSIILEGSRISGLLVGQNSDYKSLSAPSYPALIENCYAACDGSGIVVASGLVGSNYWHYGDVFHCFWDAQACGIADDASGGMPRTTAEMHTASTFLEAGWDFIDETANGTEDIWWILEGQDYPRLWWEVMPGN